MMENYRPLRDSQIVILGVCIVAATVFASWILAQGAFRVVKFNQQQITVTGSAQKEIKSDFIVWRGTVVRREADLKTAYQNLKADVEKVRAYLLAKGIAAGDMLVAQAYTETIYRKNDKGSDTNEVEAYRLRQSVEVRSSNTDLVGAVSRESTDLIDQGIEFESESPQYFYSKLDGLKIEMLGQATENAKGRAAQMTAATGNKIGFMRQARMGVFQITPANSTEVADWGVNDTSSLYKKVTAVVNVSFAIE